MRNLLPLKWCFSIVVRRKNFTKSIVMLSPSTLKWYVPNWSNNSFTMSNHRRMNSHQGPQSFSKSAQPMGQTWSSLWDTSVAQPIQKSLKQFGREHYAPSMAPTKSKTQCTVPIWRVMALLNRTLCLKCCNWHFICFFMYWLYFSIKYTFFYITSLVDLSKDVKQATSDSLLYDTSSTPLIGLLVTVYTLR